MGSVFKRGKYWYIDYYADGKRHRKSHGRIKKFAELRLKEIELQIAREELKIPKDAAIDEFFDNFLTYAQAHVREKTLEKYRTVINNLERFRSKFKSVNMLSKITPVFLEEYKLYRLKNVSKGTVNHDVKIIGIILGRAVAHNLIKRSPAKEVKRFSEVKKNPRFFSVEKIRMILERCQRRWYPAYVLLLNTGMRRGEAANLEWEDVDFERMVIKVRTKSGWSPKGKQEREIPINDDLFELLSKMRKEKKEKDVLEKGDIRDYDRALWENFWRLAQKLGIKDVNIHTFRHTFASYLLMNGVDIVTVKELLGHGSIETTMRYAHLKPSHKHWAVNRICGISGMGAKWPQSKEIVM